MDTLNDVLLAVSALTFPLYLCVSNDQRHRFFVPPSGVLALLDSAAFAAGVVLIGRRMFGYHWTDLDRSLFLMMLAGFSFHNISMFLYLKFSSSKKR